MAAWGGRRTRRRDTPGYDRPMARFYAQLCVPIFIVLVVVGILLGNAAPHPNGVAGGNLGSITLHMTWARDALDGVLLVAFVYVGFLASRTAGRWTTLLIGVVTLGLGIVGFVVGDNDGATKTWAGLNFPVVINLFDVVVGTLALLAAAGTLSDHEIPQGSIIRPDATPASGTPAGAKK